MAEDGLQAFYAARLWRLIPGVYRTADLPDIADPGGTTPGPLRELVERIAAQIAAQRRSIDAMARLGNIETADDWAIPYLADLVATRLVGSMDARAQRIDVARTIAYRRRAGTLALIERLATDVTGHDGRAVEFFRRLGRSRHGFDPDFADPREILVAERLVGRASGSPAGGTADLRKAWAASASTGAFDEYAHSADVRRPSQANGHHLIPRVGVYLWWLYAYPIDGATPVQRKGCPNEYSFDPTGRDTPLRGAGARSSAQFDAAWTSPEPWELPIEISTLLWQSAPTRFYPDSLAVLLAGGGTAAPAPLADLAIDPERGRFRFPKGAPGGGDFLSRYCHGFAGPVGAQGQADALPPVADEPAPAALVAGGTLPVLAGTLLFDDSKTYAGPAGPIAVNAGSALVLRARSGRRPVIRWTSAGDLVVTGGDSDARLVLRGLHWQGANLVLDGHFRSVTLSQATLDPGSLADDGTIGTAIDGISLAPSAITVRGSVKDLILDRAICGPIATSGSGVVERLTLRDSIVQSIVTGAPALDFDAGEGAFERSTILGPVHLHRLSASECLFDEPVTVDDGQHGCIRFCTYATGSVLHQPYRSVAIPPRSAIFHSRRFGQPGYARLRDDADRAIPSPQPGQSIRTGAEDGRETGAFSSERASLKARSLIAKLEEFMPIGTVPVLIDAG